MRKTAGIAWRLLLIIAVVVLAIYAMSQVTVVFIAVFVALVITSLLHPLVDLIDRLLPRPLAVVVALVIAFAAIGGLITFVVESVVGQWSSLSEQFTRGISDLLNQLQHLPFGLSVTNSQLQQWFSDGENWVQEHQQDLINRAAGDAAAGAGSLFEVLATLALAIFCTIFFLARGSRMWTWFINQLPTTVREKWVLGGETAWFTFSGFTRGTVLVALADGILAGTVLLILGVPLALPLAVLVFISAFIPLVGAPIAMTVAMVVALATKGPIIAIVVGAGIVLIAQFEGHVLSPLIMSRQVALHPVAVALSVTTGTLVGGILGALVIIPIVSVVWAVYAALRSVDPPMPDDELAAIKAKAVAAHKRRSTGPTPSTRRRQHRTPANTPPA